MLTPQMKMKLEGYSSSDTDDDPEEELETRRKIVASHKLARRKHKCCIMCFKSNQRIRHCFKRCINSCCGWLFCKSCKEFGDKITDKHDDFTFELVFLIISLVIFLSSSFPYAFIY